MLPIVAAGVPPLQIVSPVLDIVPVVKAALTVTCIVAVGTDSQATLFNVEMVILLYCVVAVNQYQRQQYRLRFKAHQQRELLQLLKRYVMVETQQHLPVQQPEQEPERLPIDGKVQ